jgi:hypothetical protein
MLSLSATIIGCADDPEASLPAAQESIDSEGGTVEIEGASVEIPEGALDEAVDIGVEVLDGVDGDLPEGSSLAGEAVAFLPHGTTFSTPVTVTLSHDGSATSVMRLDDENDTSWEAMSDITINDTTVEVRTLSFSILAAVAGVAGGSCAGGTEITGTIDVSATNPPSVSLDGYRVTILWRYDAGDGDRIYKFGEGDVTGSNVTLCVPDTFPTVLTDSGPFHFGTAAFFSASTFPADGEVTEAMYANLAAHGDGAYFVVKHPSYATGSPPAGFWANDFPMGMACGVCTLATTPDTFDTLTEVSCAGSDLEVTDGSVDPECNLF